MTTTASTTLNLGSVADTYLWDKLRDGDQEAFSTLYQRYVDVLLNYGRNLTNDVELVRDCIHSVFLNLWLKHERLSKVKQVKYYLFKVIRRKIGRERTSARNNTYPDTLMAVVSCEEQLIKDITRREQIEALQRQVNNLTKRQRQIIYLRYYENLSNEEIASTVGININTVYNTISLALRTLKKQMKA